MPDLGLICDSAVYDHRFWAKVEKSDGCWIWTASTTGGYGYFTTPDGQRYAHRLAFEALVGPVPVGDVIDHTCHSWDETCPGGRCAHRRCVNPAHLEVVTVRENLARGRTLWAVTARIGKCQRGHDYAPPGRCKPCDALRARGVRARAKVAANA